LGCLLGILFWMLRAGVKGRLKNNFTIWALKCEVIFEATLSGNCGIRRIVVMSHPGDGKLRIVVFSWVENQMFVLLLGPGLIGGSFCSFLYLL